MPKKKVKTTRTLYLLDFPPENIHPLITKVEVIPNLELVYHPDHTIFLANGSTEKTWGRTKFGRSDLCAWSFTYVRLHYTEESAALEANRALGALQSKLLAELQEAGTARIGCDARLRKYSKVRSVQASKEKP